MFVASEGLPASAHISYISVVIIIVWIFHCLSYNDVPLMLDADLQSPMPTLATGKHRLLPPIFENGKAARKAAGLFVIRPSNTGQGVCLPLFAVARGRPSGHTASLVLLRSCLGEYSERLHALIHYLQNIDEDQFKL